MPPSSFTACGIGSVYIASSRQAAIGKTMDPQVIGGWNALLAEFRAQREEALLAAEEPEGTRRFTHYRESCRRG